MDDSGGWLPFLLLCLSPLLAAALVLCGKTKAGKGDGLVPSTTLTTQRGGSQEDDRSRSRTFSPTRSSSKSDSRAQCPQLTFEDLPISPLVKSPPVQPPEAKLPEPELKGKEIAKDGTMDTQTQSTTMVDSQGDRVELNEQGQYVREYVKDETVNMVRTNFGHTQSVGQKDASGAEIEATIPDSSVPSIPESLQIEKKKPESVPVQLGSGKREKEKKEKEKSRVREKEKERDRERNRSGSKKHGGFHSRSSSGRKKRSSKRKKSKKSRCFMEKSDEEDERRDPDRVKRRSNKCMGSHRDDRGYQEWKKMRAKKRAEKEPESDFNEKTKKEVKVEESKGEKRMESKKEKKEEVKTGKSNKPIDPTQSD